MTEPTESSPEAPSVSSLSRRDFIVAAGGLAAGAAVVAAIVDVTSSSSADVNGPMSFYGQHPVGIAEAPPRHTYFASFTVTSTSSTDLARLLQAWTSASVHLTAGHPVAPLSKFATHVNLDSADTAGLPPSNLTLNVGLGPSLFVHDGVDRFGLVARQPSALVELPTFVNDQLLPSKIGGDLTVQACANDPQVTFHAVRELARIAEGTATLRWTQAGFNESNAFTGTPRNLMGFKDGTINPRGSQFDTFVWAGTEGPTWMIGGTYAVFRRIRIALQKWDAQTLNDQQSAVGRSKVSGAPLGAPSEFSPLDLSAVDATGAPAIALNAHVRLSAPALNDGQMILRRSYAYNDGVAILPVTRSGSPSAGTYDAGLLFCCYQRDPRKGFIPIFTSLSEKDALGQFTIHTGSAISAIPPTPAPGRWIADGLFDA